MKNSVEKLMSTKYCKFVGPYSKPKGKKNYYSPKWRWLVVARIYRDAKG